jgi:non-ribosomal peptide synthetase component F
MFAAFGVLLRAYSRRYTFGVMTRLSSKLEHMIGWLASGYMISLSIVESMRFDALIRQARDQVIDLRVHQGLPTPPLLRHLASARTFLGQRCQPFLSR